jgi:glycosyltransferase involved in cell wall biosynthesis
MENKTYGVSVIIPAYNCIKSLKYCVDSVLRQTYADFELILTDDGSKDGSGELCDEFAARDKRIRVIHKPNGGVSSARNTGIDAANGEYITFCDSDDYLEPNYLATLVNTAEKNPDCGHIWCGFQTVTGYKKENAVPNFTASEAVTYYTLKDYMTLHEMWLDTGPWNKLYKTEIIKNSKVRFSEDLSLGEDWLFNLSYIDASENDKFAVISKPLYNYVRGNSDSLDSKYRKDLLDIYRRLNSECLAHLKSWNVPEAQIEKFYDSRFYSFEKVLYNTMRAPDMSRREKIRLNSEFMSGEEFREALRTRKCFVHPLYLAAYKSGNFSNVLLADSIHKLKKHIKK